ncbi:N-substituted formamide deformylase precursor [Posidoniimonas polymericola]|uniref:N-substituted formamide deformylase n=1 Tax=Posidoniimonas polymericola TaxID=2528002 RepID=A0A5C5YH51_9BACT|nr:amidohydrolase [Posidoniimonas polymericola]TWT74564.1 N-substituted formamide deformylase precursor [Posidoniimonas polymericola]
MMRLTTAATIALLIANLTPCCSAEDGPATLIVVGGPVWTADPARPTAEAVAVRGNKIVAVGSRADVEALADQSTRVVDAGGGLVIPGCIDSHVHVFTGGSNLSGVQLRDADSRELFVRRIAEHAATLPAGEWITGGDWDHTLWGGELPDREWIDEAAGDHPVWIKRLDGHMGLASSLTLKMAGVDDQTEAPDGGAIERDASGRVTGLLRDNAMGLIGGVLPQPSAETMLRHLDAATDYMLERGVTSICQMGSLRDLTALRAARSGGRLRMRVRAYTPLERWELLQRDVQENGPGDDWLRINGLKGFVDGSLGSHTAAMLEPFDDKPSDRGLLVNRPEDLLAWTRGADRAGLQVVVHAIGDRANRIQLDIFEQVARENGPRDRRFRIEHAQHPHADDIPRFGGLGVIASMQPYHAIDDGRWAEPLIGVNRCRTTYAFRSLLDTGAKLAFGSDWFVAPASVAMGLEAAVNRRTLDGKNPDGWYPEQRISLDEALRAYTADAAYAMFDEDKLGMLSPGRLADIVVFDVDPREAPAKVSEAQVGVTIVDGRVVYEAQR